jgi:hypothetical protein
LIVSSYEEISSGLLGLTITYFPDITSGIEERKILPMDLNRLNFLHGRNAQGKPSMHSHSYEFAHQPLL